MDWKILLSTSRLVAHGQTKFSKAQNQREEFERDYSRILYSNAFRRLNSKTQVFPMPENDHVHTRLTHSLEVADVGKTLGKKVGAEIIKKHYLTDYTSWDFGYIVASACLAHDIGNPPFGHSGEDTISEYFKSKDAEKYIKNLKTNEIVDLQNFEGNAQGFRILTHTSDRYANGGMQLTLPTLATYTKYPQVSENICKKCGFSSRKKYGIFHSELPLFETIAHELKIPGHTGIPNSWKRYPLAFLTEAADDICYHILDLEDGCMLGLLNENEYTELIQPIAQVPNEKLQSCNRKRERVTLLRAFAINALVNQAVEVFLNNEEDMLNGQYDEPLTRSVELLEPLSEIKNFTFRKCYRHPDVVKIELAGYDVIYCIFSHFMRAIDNPKSKEYGLLKEHINEEYTLTKFEESNQYHKILTIIDIVSAMTDRFAVSLYKNLKGIELSSI